MGNCLISVVFIAAQPVRVRIISACPDIWAGYNSSEKLKAELLQADVNVMHTTLTNSENYSIVDKADGLSNYHTDVLK